MHSISPFPSCALLMSIVRDPIFRYYIAPRGQVGPRCPPRSGPDGLGADSRPSALSDREPGRSPPF